MAKLDPITLTVRVKGRIFGKELENCHFSTPYKEQIVAIDDTICVEDLKGEGWIFSSDTIDNMLPPSYSSMELPELDNLEKADSFVKNLPELAQAYLYKVLYLNDMRIEKAERLIRQKK